MIFRIADDFHAPSTFENSIALGDGIRGVIRSLRLNVRTDFANDRANVELGKNHDGVDRGEGSDNFSPLLFREHWASFAFKPKYRFIRINRDDEFGAQLLGCIQISNMPNMQQVECTVCEDDAFPRASPFPDKPPEFAAADNFAIPVQYAMYSARN